ncbi:hypothetical protein BDP27DRAFT_1367834 [Rhodocollybia butyracea]|uniref:Uncharacterized protein n=1 Tax=Rhodocollybia butyracea TaxID=206335 RepID=A0A9P5PJA7_9AGAR|nr:hypothetical protein BDP27DRAFT_1367834 [Rhodocollybia butyracea]
MEWNLLSCNCRGKYQPREWRYCQLCGGGYYKEIHQSIWGESAESKGEDMSLDCFPQVLPPTSKKGVRSFPSKSFVGRPGFPKPNGIHMRERVDPFRERWMGARTSQGKERKERKGMVPGNVNVPSSIRTVVPPNGMKNPRSTSSTTPDRRPVTSQSKAFPTNLYLFLRET